MCVIFVKGDKEINVDIFENMYNRNKDGVGVCFRTKTGITVKKAYPKTWEECKEWLTDTVPKKCFEKDGFLAAHFRISTSGGVSINKCHPFMITEDIGKIDESTEFTVGKNDYVLFHNGDMSSILNDEEKKKLTDFNDTQLVIANYIAKMLPALGPGRTMHVMSKMTTSRLLIINSKNYYSCGSWDKWEDHWVSNKSFIPYVKSSGVSYGTSYYSGNTSSEKYCYYCGAWTYNKEGVCFLCSDLIAMTKNDTKSLNCGKCDKILADIDEQKSGMCASCLKKTEDKCSWCKADLSSSNSILYDHEKERVCDKCFAFSSYQGV